MGRTLKKNIFLMGGIVFFMAIFSASFRIDAAKNQWVKKAGYRYYYDANGKRVKNSLKKIGKRKYYFDANGRMVKRKLKMIRGKLYYFRSDGKAAVGWRTLAGKDYYFTKGAYAAKGLTEIDGKTYYFAEDGTKQTGWKLLGSKKAYFYKKTGQMAVNRTIDGQKINKQGYASLTKAEKTMQKAEKKAKEILQSITNERMSKSEKLHTAFRYMSDPSRFGYVTWRVFQAYEGWEYDYALEIYEKRGGNCYNFACGFAMLAKAIGYEPYIIRGRIPGERDGSSDGLTRHAVVLIDGLYYDPEAECAGFARGIYASELYPMTLQVLGKRKI